MFGYVTLRSMAMPKLICKGLGLEVTHEKKTCQRKRQLLQIHVNKSTKGLIKNVALKYKIP